MRFTVYGIVTERRGFSTLIEARDKKEAEELVRRGMESCMEAQGLDTEVDVQSAVESTDVEEI